MRFEYADERMPAAMTAGGLRYYLAYDQVGSLIAVADGSGSVVKRISYDSFGNILEDTNPAFAVPFGFAGGLHDRDTGLVRFGYRDYDPEVGRWTAKDPIGFAGGDTDLYGYVLNNPTNIIDSFGLLTPNWHFGITFVVARSNGFGFFESVWLGIKTAAVDFASQGTSSTETVQHAMAAAGQSPAEAIAATNAYIQTSINSGNLPGAIHAAQDLATPGHAGQEWIGFKWHWNTAEHILGDVFPFLSTINQAFQNTKGILNPCRK
jgi:RHS repeat-associated protein